MFVSYHTMLSRNGLLWLLKDNQKVGVTHVLSAIRPATLTEQLEGDLDFAHHGLKKDFQGFMRHAIKIAEAFQLVDNGKPRSERAPTRPRGTGNNETNKTLKTRTRNEQTNTTNKNIPFCLHPPCKSKGLRHYMRDCRSTTDDEKKTLLKALSEEKARTGPSRSTRSQTRTTPTTTKADTTTTPKPKTTGRTNRKIKIDESSPSFPITVKDGKDS